MLSVKVLPAVAWGYGGRGMLVAGCWMLDSRTAN